MTATFLPFAPGFQPPQATPGCRISSHPEQWPLLAYTSRAESFEGKLRDFGKSLWAKEQRDQSR